MLSLSQLLLILGQSYWKLYKGVQNVNLKHQVSCLCTSCFATSLASWSSQDPPLPSLVEIDLSNHHISLPFHLFNYITLNKWNVEKAAPNTHLPNANPLNLWQNTRELAEIAWK